MSFETPGREAVAAIAKYWWLFLVTGILWLIVAIIILQYNAPATATVGYLVGFMLLFTGIEQFFVSSSGAGWRALWIIFGIFFVIGGIWAILNPFGTAFALATSLGLLFALFALFWIIEAFAVRSANPLWWLGLMSGIIMGFLAYWASGQTTPEKVVTLLTFAGVWAIMHGITDIIRAFQLKRVGTLVA